MELLIKIAAECIVMLLVTQTLIFAKLSSDKDLDKLFCRKNINCGEIKQSSAIPQELLAHRPSPCITVPNCTCSKSANVHLGHIVNCSAKSFRQVPEGLPSDTTLMYLSNNKIEEVTGGIFEHYRRLIFLDLSKNRIIKLSQNTFKGLGHLQYLLLNGNKIRYDNTSIHPDAFVWLNSLTNLRFQQDLHDIQAQETYPGESLAKLGHLQCLGLDGLPNKPVPQHFSSLKYLNILTFNGFDGRCHMPAVNKTTLEHLSNLTYLQISKCRLTNVGRGAFSSHVSLQLLDLSYNEELEFRSLPNITHELNKTAIKTLCFNKIHKTFGSCTVITAKDFEFLGVIELQYIALEANRLSILEPDAVQFIPKTLKGISVEDNMLLIGLYILELLKQMKYRFSKLEILLLAKQHMPHTFHGLYTYHALEQQSTSFKNQTQRQTSQMLSKANSNVHLQPTYLDTYVPDDFFTIPTEEVNERHGQIERNHLQHDTKIYVQPTPDVVNDHIQGIETVVCSNCVAMKIDLKWILPPKLKILDFSDFILNMHLEKLCFCEPNMLQTLRFSGTLIWQWTSPASGMQNLTELDLSKNYCQYLSNNIFHNMPNLQKINASNNFLSLTLSHDSKGELFSRQSKLQSLDLSDNKLQAIPDKLFEGLISLENISLSDNQLTNISFKLDHMTNLKYINLHNNFLEQVDSQARQHFDRIDSTNNLSIDLSNNRFKCNCDTRDFIKWLSETRVHLCHKETYTCEFDNKTIGNLTYVDHIYKSLDRKCTSYLSLILSTVATLVVLITTIVCSLVYRYRWDLRYMYYSAKIRSRKYFPLEHGSVDYDHDVFVSYSDREGWFIRRCLVPELEEKRGIRLLVHDRDFSAGNFVYDNIMQAITTSRKTLVILSQSFLKSSWCNYELNMARMEGIKTGRNVLCILMKEEVSMSGLPLEVIDVIEQQTYASVPDDAEQEEEFWDKLKSSLLE